MGTAWFASRWDKGEADYINCPMTREQYLAFHAGLTMHVTLVAGRDPHHIAEAEYKAFARAFRQAKALDPLVAGIPSTKGAL